MRRNVLTIGIALAIVGSSPSILLSQSDTAATSPTGSRLSSAAKAGDDLEDRLLEAELLEVASGDLDRAVKIYTVLAESEAATESIRARALLYLARCRRKTGEIEEARKILERVVAAHPEERRVIQEARVFLRELERGTTENPEFDWLGELGRSELIQARVFDLAMDLVSPETDEGRRARRQLKALGAIGVPVLSRVLSTSRDRTQRWHLALVLIELGRHENWSVLLGEKDPIPSAAQVAATDRLLFDHLTGYLDRAAKFSPEERKEIGSRVDALPITPGTAEWRSLVALQIDAVDDFRAILPSLESFSMFERLRAFLRRHPELAGIVAERILADDCRNSRTLISVLEAVAPEALGVAQWTAILDETIARSKTSGTSRLSYGSVKTLLANLERGGAFEILADRAERGAGNAVANYFHDTYVATGKVADAPAAWSSVLAQCGFFDQKQRAVPKFRYGHELLGAAAIVDARFASAFGEFLMNYRTEHPSLAKALQSRNNVLGSSFQPEVVPTELVTALTPVLASGDENAVRTVLHLLWKTENLHGSFLERLASVASASADAPFRERALTFLADHYDRQPGLVAPRLVHLLKVHLDQVIGPQDRAGRLRRPSKPLPRGLYGEILKELDTPGLDAVHRYYLRGIPSQDFDSHRDELLARCSSLRTPAARAEALRSLTQRSFERAELTDFAQSIAQSAEMDVDIRDRAVSVDPTGSFEWFDWAEMFVSDDPLASRLLMVERRRTDGRTRRVGGRLDYSRDLWRWIHKREPEVRARLLEAALTSDKTNVRVGAYRHYPFADEKDTETVLRLLRRGLADPSEWVHGEPLAELEKLTRSDVAPIFVELARSEKRVDRLAGIAGLERFAAPEGIEPLTVLLDDPDVDLRARALNALRSIRKTLEERREWKALVESLRTERAEGEP